MSSLSLRVLELFDENKLRFEETEKLLQAISTNSFTKLSVHNKRRSAISAPMLIPPHSSSYMNNYTLNKHI